jgi:hypothetical protein
MSMFVFVLVSEDVDEQVDEELNVGRCDSRVH